MNLKSINRKANIVVRSIKIMHMARGSGPILTEKRLSKELGNRTNHMVTLAMMTLANIELKEKCVMVGGFARIHRIRKYKLNFRIFLRH